MDRRAAFGWRDDQVAGLVQQRMHWRVGARVHSVRNDAGFALAPVAARDRCAFIDLHEVQRVAREQRACRIEPDVGEGQHSRGRCRQCHPIERLRFRW